jgi:hypothetical protein
MTTGIARIVKTEIGGETIDISVLTAFGGEEVYLKTKKMDFGDADLHKAIAAVLVNVTGRGEIDDLKFYIGVSERFEETSTWHGPYSLAEADDLIWVKQSNGKVLPKARYIEFKLVDSLPMTQWKLSNIQFFGRVVKGRR